MKQLFRIASILLILLPVIACSTSSGSLFKETRDSDKGNDYSGSSHTPEDEEPFYPEDDDEYEEQDGLYITSYPFGAGVYLDNHFKGKTPLFIPNIKPGNYKLELNYPGYYSHEEWIYYAGDYMAYRIRLEPVTGYMHIEVDQVDAIILLDNEKIKAGETEIRIGTYTLSVKKFGFTEYRETVTILEDQTTTVKVSLSQAPFAVSKLEVNREKFNPANPGPLGKIDLSFYVTSFGSGTMTIVDINGEIIYSYSFPEFQTWYQYAVWNGRLENNTVCPDGEYRIMISAESKNDGRIHTLSKEIRIDSSFTITYRNLWNGTSGLMYTCTGDVLPGSSFQISSLFTAHFEHYEDQVIMRAPTQFGVRFGIGSNMELDFLTCLIFTDSDFIPFTGSAALKYQLFRSGGSFRIESVVYVKAAYHYGTGADTFSNYTGLSAGFPFQISGGPLFLILNPEIIISPYAVTYSPDYDTDVALNIWGYGRIGLMLDLGVLITGISCALRTTSFLDPENFDIHYPILGAYELHYMVPESNIYVSITAAAEYESVDNYYIMGGIGLGFIY